MHRPTHADGTPYDILVLSRDEAEQRAEQVAREYQQKLEEAQLLASENGMDQFAARMRFERELSRRRYGTEDATTTREIAEQAA